MSADLTPVPGLLKQVDLGAGRSLEARVVGKGECAPLLLLHGVGGNCDAWGTVLTALAKDRQVIAWNAPGYGASTNFEQADPDLDAYASAALALLEALNIERADVLGHSMGGLIAARMATLAPAHVDRLVLADCSSGHGGYDAGQRQQILQTRLSQDASDPWVYARMRAPKLLSPHAPAAILEQATAMLARLKQPGFGQAARMVSASDIFAFTGSIDAKTAVICGTADIVTPEALNERIASAIAGATYAAIEGAGHWSFLERPRSFGDLAARHLLRTI